MSDEPSEEIQKEDETGGTQSESQPVKTKSPSKKSQNDQMFTDPVADSEIDVVGGEDEEPEFQIVMPSVTSSGEILDASMRTPTKESVQRERELMEEEEEMNPADREKVFSSFPCQVIPETLSRLTRTPPDGEHLEVQKNKNGRLRIYVTEHFKKFSPYSTLTHKPCTVCNRMMKSGEMHLNFPADLDRRRIWANLLGFKYKDILRSKMGPVSFSIAAGPICTEHFAEECFRNHNFNKSAIEAFGVPVAISPDVKTTPSKKRVPWVCTICEFHSCSVVELQTHLLDHTETMLKKKDNILEVPEAGFMCPFCRKCTYGYKTVTGYRRHLNAAPAQHCHLRRIYEFAKMNCRSSELEPIEKWDNWTRRNVYVAYHGCEPPANEVVLTPSPTKSIYPQNPEERTRIVQDEERRRKAVRSLAFVGKEGGTSVNDHNVMQRAVYLQMRRNKEHRKKYPCPEDDLEEELPGMMDKEDDGEAEDILEETKQDETSPQLPMGAEKRKSRRLATSVTNSPVKKEPEPSVASCPVTPAKKKVKLSSEESEELVAPKDEKELKQSQKERDERFAQMVAKRSQQAKRLMNAKQFKKEASVTKKPRKALAYQLVKGTGKETEAEGRPEELEDEEEEESTPAEQTPEPSTSTARRTSSRNAARRKSKSKEPTPPLKSVKKETPKEPEERPLKSMLARSMATGARLSMAKYHVPIDAFSTSAGPLSGKSLSTGSIATSSSAPVATSSTAPPSGSLFPRVHGQEKPSKRPTVLGRRPLILSPRKRAAASSSSSASSHPFTHHESSPIISSGDSSHQVLIPTKEMNVEMIEEVIDEVASSSAQQKPITLAEALEMKSSGVGLKDQELEEISKEMMKESTYYRAMEDAIKCKTVTKIRADLRVSRHCIRQIEAARARARLFGEGSEDQYQILYSNEGAQVVPKSQLHQSPDDHHQQ